MAAISKRSELFFLKILNSSEQTLKQCWSKNFDLGIIFFLLLEFFRVEMKSELYFLTLEWFAKIQVSPIHDPVFTMAHPHIKLLNQVDPQWSKSQSTGMGIGRFVVWINAGFHQFFQIALKFMFKFLSYFFCSSVL